MLWLYGSLGGGDYFDIEMLLNYLITISIYIIIPMLYQLITKNSDNNKLKEITIISTVIISLFVMIFIDIYEPESFWVDFIVNILLGIGMFYAVYYLFYNENAEKNTQKKEKSEMDIKYSDLKKLKNLLDEKIITQEEFEKEKKKILK